MHGYLRGSGEWELAQWFRGQTFWAQIIKTLPVVQCWTLGNYFTFMCLNLLISKIRKITKNKKQNNKSEVVSKLGPHPCMPNMALS